MAVSEEFDRDLRGRLAAHLAAARTLVDLGVVAADGPPVWPITASSPAATDRGVETLMWAFLVAELDGDGTVNLPLTQARALLTDASGPLAALGRITTDPDEGVRLAAVGPLARGATEAAALTWWVLDGADGDERRRRALAVEIEGVDNLLRYLPSIRVDRSADDLMRMRARLVELAGAEPGGYTIDRRGRVSVGGQRRPTYMALVEASAGPNAYAELSAHTHPTAHLRVASSEWSRGAHRQVVFDARSTVHDEGRLCAPAVLTFAATVDRVAAYVGADSGQVRPWAAGVAALWREWCTENGC